MLRRNYLALLRITNGNGVNECIHPKFRDSCARLSIQIMEQGPTVAAAGGFPPFLNRGNRQVSRTVVFGDRGNRVTELEIDSCWDEEPRDDVPTLIPSIKCSTPPVLEKQNSLLNDVRSRLETLRADQQKKDVELSHQRKKDAMEKALVDEEVQKLVTLKIREMSFSDAHSIQSRQTSQGRILRTAGGSCINGSVARSASTPVGGTLSSIGSPHHRNSHSEKVTGAKTFPSTNARQGLEGHEACKTHVPHLKLINANGGTSSSDHFEMDFPSDDLSEMGSQGSLGSLGSLGRIKRPPLIIIRASEINKSKIKAVVEEHLPSPKQLLEDDTFTCAALPALFRRNTNRNGFGAMSDNTFSLSRQPSQLEVARPASFLKTKSRSRILQTQPHHVEAALQHADSSAIVTGIARKHLLQRSNTRSNASQRFVLSHHREDSTIMALQSPTILEARFRGWGPAEHSSSSKHENSTNFY